MSYLRTALALSLLAVLPGAAAAQSSAQDPTGDWLVKDKVAIIRIENCGGAMWGVNAWEDKPATDSNNPDPAKRNRPTLGIPILLGMKPTQPNKWEGEIYNPKDGKNYTANISLAGPDVLRVTGCLLIFCGGEDWTRVHPEPSKPGTPRRKTAKEICASIPEAGPPPGPAPSGPQRQAPKR